MFGLGGFHGARKDKERRKKTFLEGYTFGLWRDIFLKG